METTELIDCLSRGEDSRHQFKENFTNADALAAEIVAFANTAGGQIFIGVQNDGTVLGLSHADIDRLNQLISNSASQNVRPAVNPLTENVPHPNGTVMVVTVAEGVSKPYTDKNGAIWVKNGSDKRRATSREEIQRMFQQAGLVHADETPESSLSAGDVDLPYLRNPILASFAAKLLPYRGLGSGLLRALRAWPQIELIDDRAGNLFKAIVKRPQEQAA